MEGPSTEPFGRAYDRLFDRPVAAIWAAPVVLVVTALASRLWAYGTYLYRGPILSADAGIWAGASLTAGVVVSVVLDATVLWLYHDWEGTFRSRLPGLAAWGAVVGLVFGSLLVSIGLVVDRADVDWLVAVVPLAALSWPVLTPYVSPAIVDGRSLRGAIRVNRREFRHSPWHSLVIGGMVSALHASVVAALAVSVSFAFVGAVLFWLILPIALFLLGSIAAVAVVLATPTVYAYTRALKLEAYRTIGGTVDYDTTA